MYTSKLAVLAATLLTVAFSAPIIDHDTNVNPIQIHTLPSLSIRQATSNETTTENENVTEVITEQVVEVVASPVRAPDALPTDPPPADTPGPRISSAVQEIFNTIKEDYLSRVAVGATSTGPWTLSVRAMATAAPTTV